MNTEKIKKDTTKVLDTLIVISSLLDLNFEIDKQIKELSLKELQEAMNSDDFDTKTNLMNYSNELFDAVSKISEIWSD